MNRSTGALFTASAFSILILSSPTLPAGEPTTLYDQALLLEQSGDYEGAVTEYTRAEIEAREAGDMALAAQAALKVSDCHRELGNAVEFRRKSDDALRTYGDDPWASARSIVRIGEDAWRRGSRNAARDLLSRIERQFPTDTEAKALAHLQLGEMELSAGDPDAALEEAQTLLNRGTGTESWYPDARILSNRAKVGAAARKVTRSDSRAQGVSELKAVIDDPAAATAAKAWAHYHLSLAKYWERDYAGSISEASMALTVAGTEGERSLLAWASLQSAISRIAAGDVDGAYQAIIGCNRNHADYDDDVFQHHLSDRFKEIVEAKRQAGDIPPEPADPDPVLSDEAKAQTEAAFALVYIGDATQAISLLQTVITDYAGQPAAVGMARYRLAEAYYQNRDYPNAISTCTALLTDYSPNVYTILCAWADLMLGTAQLANGQLRTGLETLERCERAYSLVEDEGYQSSLGSRLAAARSAVRPLARAEKLSIVNDPWQPRERRRNALRQYAHLCEKAGDRMGALRANVRLRQHFGDDPTTLQKANKHLEETLGKGNVPEQVAILRQAQKATDDVAEKEIIQEEIAWRYLAAGYVDEATAACREALDRFGREAARSYRLAVTQGDAYMRADKPVQALLAYRRGVPAAFVHSRPHDRLAEKLGWIHGMSWGTDSALGFLDKLELTADEAKRLAWKIRFRTGSDEDIALVRDDAESLVAAASTVEELLTFTAALIRAQLSEKDFASVNLTLSDLRAQVKDDERVDRVLMDIVSGHLGPRGEVLLTDIIENSTSEAMKQFATFEMGWCRRYQKDRQGALDWFEAAAAMECLPGTECLYPWKAHMEAAGIYRAKGKDFLPFAEVHLQDALLLAQDRYPEGVAAGFLALGDISEVRGELATALDLYESAAEAAGGDDQRDIWAEAMIRIGRVRLGEGNRTAARTAFEDVASNAFHRGYIERAQRFLARLDGEN
jgi:tetratricopeptide (TPR) repeat protein